jgi:hypothetical protein
MKIRIGDVVTNHDPAVWYVGDKEPIIGLLGVVEYVDPGCSPIYCNVVWDRDNRGHTEFVSGLEVIDHIKDSPSVQKRIHKKIADIQRALRNEYRDLQRQFPNTFGPRRRVQ